MYFDAPEKKCEVRVHASCRLREKGEAFWREIVAISRAEVLSVISSRDCDAYLLSESSLFVYEHKCLMITCGQTDLAMAMVELMNRIGFDSVESFLYERKQGYFPQDQPFLVEDDLKLLAERMPTHSFVFNESGKYPVHFTYLDKPCLPEEEDTTVEILMHGLDAKSIETFSSIHEKKLRQHEDYQNLVSLVEGFKIDEYFFDPAGYSLNALREKHYCTVHVTPQMEASYVSIETNAIGSSEELNRMIEKSMNIFKPKHFDLIVFESEKKLKPLILKYVSREVEEKKLRMGYELSCFHFDREDE